MELPENTNLKAFADDVLLVCRAREIKFLLIKLNESLRRVERCLYRHGLQMALEKTEALLVTVRRGFEAPKVKIGGTEVSWGKKLQYLGATLDQRLNKNQTRR